MNSVAGDRNVVIAFAALGLEHMAVRTDMGFDMAINAPETGNGAGVFKFHPFATFSATDMLGCVQKAKDLYARAVLNPAKHGIEHFGKSMRHARKHRVLTGSDVHSYASSEKSGQYQLHRNAAKNKFAMRQHFGIAYEGWRHER
jgi:hypothetical protein